MGAITWQYDWDTGELIEPTKEAIERARSETMGSYFAEITPEQLAAMRDGKVLLVWAPQGHAVFVKLAS
jgi:hypothetical protein